MTIDNVFPHLNNKVSIVIGILQIRKLVFRQISQEHMSWYMNLHSVAQ